MSLLFCRSFWCRYSSVSIANVATFLSLLLMSLSRYTFLLVLRLLPLLLHFCRYFLFHRDAMLRSNAWWRVTRSQNAHARRHVWLGMAHRGTRELELRDNLSATRSLLSEAVRHLNAASPPTQSGQLACRSCIRQLQGLIPHSTPGSPTALPPVSLTMWRFRERLKLVDGLITLHHSPTLTARLSLVH